MMISRLQSEYTGRVAEIWLEGNLNAHCFIPAQYWRDNFELVKGLLGQAEVYVYEDARQIQGFIGLNDEYIEGIFVSDEMRSQGIGKILLDFVKNRTAKLSLNVYQKTHGRSIFISGKALRSGVKGWMKLPVKRSM